MTDNQQSQEPEVATAEQLSFNAARFKLIEENQPGTLEIGRRKYPMNVVEMSVCQFSAIVDHKPSQKVRVGGYARIRILDKDCKVAIRKKRLLDHGKVQLELEQIDEPIKPERKAWTLFSTPKTVQLSGGDSLMPVVIVFAALITILIIPSFGGRWGTSRVISEAVETTMTLALDAFKKK
jgi:hypothetical protein